MFFNLANPPPAFDPSNLAVFIIKMGAYFYTSSATMLSEAIHSLADMLNQVACARVLLAKLMSALHMHVLHVLAMTVCVCVPRVRSVLV